MKKTLLAGVSAGLLVAAAASAANAQSIDYGSLEQLFNEPVTTSATGAPQRSTEAPVDMTIISAADIQRSGATDLPTILSRVAGLDVEDRGAGASDVSVRGYNQAMSPRLLVLINGRQVYLDHYGYTAWATLPVQLSEIRQIEVVKGPNSALFGFNAVGGVVNIITVNPKFDNTGDITVRAGTAGYGEVSLAKSFKVGERFSARVSAGASQSDEFKNTVGVAKALLNDPAKLSANIDTVTQLTDKVELRVEGSYSNVQVSDMLSNYAYSPSKYLTSSLKGTLAAETKVGELQLTAYQNDLTAKHVILGQKSRFENKITVVSAQDLFKIGAKHTLRVGAEYRHNEVNTAPIGGAEVSYDVLAASAMWNWAITDKLAFTAAGRYDSLDLSREGTFPAGSPPLGNGYWDRKIEEPSYNLGLVWRATDVDTFKATAARGVQVPTLIDLGALQARVTVGPYTIGLAGNPTLEPAIITNYQLTYERALPAIKAEVSAKVFVQKTEDVKGQPTSAQIDVPATLVSLPVLSYRNIGESKMNGFELAASGQLTGGFRWNADLTHTEVDDEPNTGFSAVIRTAAYGETTPENRGNVSFGWTDGAWTADAYAHVVGQHKAYALYSAAAAPNLVNVEAYTAIGGRVARAFDHGVTVALSGQNLGDNRQRQSAGLEVERRLFLSVSKTW
ncbi:TonB-dependent receptor plug domain-containing protein [Caulobacter hibisci]|uniref:TonB-dependent receptor n=1 Tax=Caulobacter hibisci TaxID=2035993 RepID=A0ABS0T7X3_9CAUL|nr:TonB-dependent receptor [Caulobacter hibisci]MBI1686947.1 TonB-dependent receptor [Caulobacter hibisci]